MQKVITCTPTHKTHTHRRSRLHTVVSERLVNNELAWTITATEIRWRGWQRRRQESLPWSVDTDSIFRKVCYKFYRKFNKVVRWEEEWEARRLHLYSFSFWYERQWCADVGGGGGDGNLISILKFIPKPTPIPSHIPCSSSLFTVSGYLLHFLYRCTLSLFNLFAHL